MTARRLAAAASLFALVLAGGGSAHGQNPYGPPGDFKPTWSPDGTVVVFASARPVDPQGQGTLRVVDHNGGGERPLPVPSTDAYAFSHDWSWIAFPSATSHALVVMHPDGSGRHEFGRPDPRAVPTWSPDGERLAFEGDDGIYVADVDGTHVARVVADGRTPDWSPTGDRIAYSVGPGPRSPVETVSASGGTPRRMSPADGRSYRMPKWSRDGTQLAMTSQFDAAERAGLTVVSSDGSDARRYPLPANIVRSYTWNSSELIVSIGALVRLWLPSGRVFILAPEATDPDAIGPVAYAAGGECRDRVGIYTYRGSNTPAVRLTNDCHVLGTAGPDVLSGTDLADVVVGLAGDDVLTGKTATEAGDTLEGGLGDDVLRGTYRGDTLDGGDGNDTLLGGLGNDSLAGGPDPDVIRAGPGSADTIYARDGERDSISCGTNAAEVRSSAPPENDQAYVDTIDDVSRDCEWVFRPDWRPPRGTTRLQVLVSAFGRHRSYVLRCKPAGGTLPHPGRACARLNHVEHPFAPVPTGATCALLSGGFQTAWVHGTYGGRRVDARFSRSDACEIERWDRMLSLFPVSTRPE